ncbi:aspartic peptidase domain-containing protein [Desarmillaria tabescens]|uniref:Aspartic peptidase domain-containing protein n=1 Tax=Armillaria tabescens TaxID=1929756 RepID=A0AA39MTV8_ARMTA|nr:aspartic peptidase domain-containing protein [Desarmillaria tabescens]KAK0445998.1 aspartic peptidase domain-containing protein [Desarmillaria tabescens]
MCPSVVLRVAIERSPFRKLLLVREADLASLYPRLGTPPREFSLWLDTGSDPTWVLSQSCIESCSISDTKRTPYIPSESSTNNATGETLRVDYLGGAVAGTIFTDTLSIANTLTGVSTRALLVGFSNWAWLDADGMLGLAFPRVEEPVHASLLESLFHPEILEAHEFAIYAGQDLSPNNGVVQFGGHSTEYNCTDVTYFNIQRYTDDNNAIIYWTTYINRVDFTLNTDGNTHSNTVFVENFAVWDTGSSHITVPETYIENIYSSIGMNYTFIQEGGRPLCEDLRKLDFNMTIILLEGTITVRPADLIVPGYTEEQYCWPLFEPSSSGRWIIGMDLIRNFYTVWNLGGWDIRSDELQPRLGFAELKAEYHP